MNFLLIPLEDEQEAPPARDVNDLTAGELRALLQIVDHLFPLPIKAGFKGKHHFQLNDQQELELRVWYRDMQDPTRFRVMTLTFDDDDGETGLVADLVAAKALVELGIKLKDGGRGWMVVPR